ncbi:iron transporter FeoA [Veillonella denticariosi JCM 15641]|uniref:Iron transporter FeoA n=1 Tax=Veillonella denticariosi JCM 15641 TaxID=1298594 RepID=A0A2S7Z716_9FIRM|nr:FeoA family protein [Veillonella denticariosi]PQL18857.1 iron transporter FeoA [Veillonella denticariosi JCM 15641]
MAIKKLKDMKVGESGVISALHGSGNVKHRLIDMGLVHGTKIHVMKFAPLGDPVEIKVKNFELALRINEAGMIDVEVQ